LHFGYHSAENDLLFIFGLLHDCRNGLGLPQPSRDIFKRSIRPALLNQDLLLVCNNTSDQLRSLEFGVRDRSRTLLS
jgi:hypothetical protein